MTQIKGVHPYADEFPMASEDELAELAASIASVGLINSVVLTPDNLVLDGRNRLKACEMAGVEPTFVVRDGDDDDYKEFVIGANTTGRRESMTVQIAAASSALILGHERRKNGRWTRNTHTHDSVSMDRTVANVLSQAGLVLDVLGAPYLRAVRDGDESLNAVYEKAKAEKNRQDNEARQRAEFEARQAQTEEEARELFINNPDARDWYEGQETEFSSWRLAREAYLEADKQAAWAAEQERLKKLEEQREHEEMIAREVNRLKHFLAGYGQAWRMRETKHRNEILQKLTDHERDRFLQIEREITWTTSLL